MKRKLTPKQKGFIKDLLITKNGAEAVRRNYNLGSKGGAKSGIQEQYTASSIAVENLKKPAIQEVLKRKGLDVDHFLDELIENQKLAKEGGYLNTHLEGIKVGLRLNGELSERNSASINVEGNAVFGYINASEVKKLQDRGDIIDTVPDNGTE